MAPADGVEQADRVEQEDTEVRAEAAAALWRLSHAAVLS